MTAQIKQVNTERDGVRADALNLLEEAKQKGFDFVVVIGLSDGVAWCKGSRQLDTLKAIGACEYAKDTLMKNWK